MFTELDTSEEFNNMYIIFYYFIAFIDVCVYCPRFAYYFSTPLIFIWR